MWLGNDGIYLALLLINDSTFVLIKVGCQREGSPPPFFSNLPFCAVLPVLPWHPPGNMMALPVLLLNFLISISCLTFSYEKALVLVADAL